MADGVELEDAWVNTNPDRTKWIRVDPEIGGLYRYNSGNGQYDIPLPIALDAVEGLTDALDGKASATHAESHEHNGDDKINQLGTVHFRDKVYAGAGDDNQGITQEITWNAGTLSIKKGIVVGWTPS